MRTRVLLMITALAVASTAGCGSGEAATPTGDVTTTKAAAAGPDLSGQEFTDLTGTDAVDVAARDNDFIEPYIEVKAGTTITFTNKGRNQHNVLPVEDGAFAKIDSTDFDPGQSVTITFSEAGDYPYYCSLHGTTTKGMIGAVRVLE